MQHKLIGIRGKIGAGKDTAAQFIVDKYKSYEIVPFARALKEVTAIVTSTEVHEQFTREGKAKIPPGLPYSLGRYQQIIGQAMKQHIHDEVWVRIALQHPAEYKIIPDVRHVCEVEAILAAGGIVINIIRPNMIRIDDGRDHNHISETALDDYTFKCNIVNDGSLEEFRSQVLAVL